MRQLVGYVRVSSVAGREDERFQSPELQREAIKRWAKAIGPHKWLAWYEDLDVTGLTQRRPGLNDAREHARKHRADIVVYDLSRWARSVEGGLRDMRLLRNEGVKVLSASEDIDPSNPAGEFSLHIFLAAAQWYAATRAESWRGVIASNKSQGLWHGRAPYGYRRPTEKEAKALGRVAGVIVPDEAAAPHVVKAFQDFVSGKTMYEIGKGLVALGAYSRVISATHLLRNPVYAGYVSIYPERSPRLGRSEDNLGEVLEDSHGRPRWRYEGEPTLIEGFHAPLIDHELWDRVQRIHETAADATPARVKAGNAGRPSWWGASIVRCAGCGRSLSHGVKPSGRYLNCQRGRAHCAGVGSVKVEQLTPQVLIELRQLADQLVMDPERRARLVSSGKTSTDLKARRAAERTVEKAKKDLVTYLARAHRDAVDDDVRAAVIEELQTDLDKAKARLAALGEPPVDAATLKVRSASLVTMADAWDQMTEEEIRRLLKAMGARIVIGPQDRRSAPLDGRVRLHVAW